ncbi:thiamine pyrophosphate enzyme, C-terminal TPP binding domain protein 3 [Achromobacter xylosoxidans A8]|uniref:Thiamine pyrophosphate enzyme, C-terminal TPP binding domain protein 3 n=1 Tax=Achromobacter xylosoxidans (strain A8) TaxID=762376 RepID=E3HX12_ACHXA|nr:acetolactate synthase large subunit [Achromobacter xylosoxidans]ADP16366.1 thiamine pyrophosphate enzyme, C-terminal TPP binding domain protein 3 [Achromobacter xylosoxidans A8]
MSGASVLLEALRKQGVEVCFANPGTTELDLVRAMEEVPGMRCVVGLQENVCTGAADGYGRLTGKPAATLLHLGPGFANGIANLHNARRARTPIVNIIGDHASWHLECDAPLTSDIESLARPVSGWVQRIASAQDAAGAARAAVRASLADGGQGATLIFPADFQAESVTDESADAAADGVATEPVAFDAAAAWQRLSRAQKPLFLLGGGGPASGLGRRAQIAAARLCAALGGKAYAETFPARSERGRGLPDFDRLPYFPEPARAALDAADLVVLVGALPPVTYFGYAGHPSRLVPAERLLELAAPGQDAASRLEALAELAGAPAFEPAAAMLPEPVPGVLTPQSIAAVVARALPDDAIVSVEGGTCGYPLYAASAGAAPHTVLTNTGGAIGQGLPVAMGAAIACPQRRVVAVLSDGSTQYTIQTLWSLAHENLPVTVLIAANHQYAILRNELRRGNAVLGERAAELTSLDRPRIDWVGLASSYGVQASRAATSEELAAQLASALRQPGPVLIEMAL